MTTRRLRGDDTGIAEAAAILRAGGLVGLPTETVYGLAGDATDPRAVARIYAAKGRPQFNPLISHVPDLERARLQGSFGPDALALARAFWPGPLTLVVPLAEKATVCELARAGLGTLALRVPDSRLALAVLEQADRPVAAPSANLSGRISPTTAGHVADDLEGVIDAILDGGPASVGVESTIVSCLSDTPHLLRPGGIEAGRIEAVLGLALAVDAPQEGGKMLLAPGMMASHYAPRAGVRLEASEAGAGEGYLAFGAAPPGTGVAMLNLSPSGDLVEAAANLFGHLRRLDGAGVGTIAVAPIPMEGLGVAINDRLRRAAAPR